MKAALALLFTFATGLVSAADPAPGPCVMEPGGCRDLLTGKLYVQQGNRLVDPETGKSFPDETPLESSGGASKADRTPGQSAPSLGVVREVFGGYRTASASGRLFHAMDVRPDKDGRVLVKLLMGLTVPAVQGCQGGGVSGAGTMAADNSVRIAASWQSASPTDRSACQIEIRFDPGWGAADVREQNCQAVHGPSCSFAGRYLRVRR